MKKALLVRLAIVGAAVVTFIAAQTAAVACGGWYYQPKMPEALRKPE